MKKIVKPVIFVLLACLMISRLYQRLRWKDTQGDYISSVMQLDASGSADIDAVFVGSSHVYAGIYPSLLWEEAGIAAFNLSISGMDRDSAYYYLKYFLKDHRPQLVVVDCYCLTFEKHALAGNVYRNYLSLPPGAESFAELKAYAERDESVSENLGDYLLRWPIIHTRYRELAREDFVPDSVNSFGKGEYLNWEVRETQAPALDVGAGELSDDQKAWLDDMSELCEEAGADLVFMILPFNDHNDAQSLMDAVALYLVGSGRIFFDFNRAADMLSLDYTTDFFDDSHVNAYGAEKITRFFRDYISSHYPIADHSGDPAYDSWNKDADYYLQRLYGDKLKQEKELADYVDLICSAPDMAAVISLEGDYTGEDYYEALARMGMEEADYARGGKWLYQDHSLTKLCENDPNAPEYVCELDAFATLRVRYLGDFCGSNVQIDRVDYSGRNACLSIVVYDQMQHHILSAMEFGERVD